MGGSGTAGEGEPDCDRTLESVEKGGRCDVRLREGLATGSGEEEYPEMGGSGTAGGGEPDGDRPLESVETGGRRDVRPREGLMTGSGVPGGEGETGRRGGDRPREGPAAG